MYTSKHISYKSVIAALFSVIMLSLAGCIKNDIPYPQIQPNFTRFSVENQIKEAQIDTVNRTINLYLSEAADIYAVKVTDYALSQGSLVNPGVFDAPLNLSSPMKVAVKLYQEYDWTIIANQDLARNFSIENQIGLSDIDPKTHTVKAYVAKDADLKSIKVTSIKLGSDNSVMTPDLNGQTVDFSAPVKVTVTESGNETVWTITVENNVSDVVTERVDAWTCVAWLYGSALADKQHGFEYRVQGSADWVAVPSEWIASNGGDFIGRLIHLKPQTNYEARAVSEGKYGEVIAFTTGENTQVPNESFDNWWLDGKVWDPWTEGGESWWDTGNKGASTFGKSNSVPTDDTSSGTGKAAMLQTKFVNLFGIGKLAAGNIFAGKFVKVDGTNGILNFGREFTARPTKLRGYFKYTVGNIDYASTEFKDLKGQPDTGVVWIALTDWNQPFEVRTNPSNRQLFNPEDPAVIAYGEMSTSETNTAYKQFEITLKYNATNRVPKYIVITASSSKLGDYFTGSTGSVMCIDDLELVYDY